VIKVEEKITIISLWKNNLSNREISKKLNISKTTVKKWISKYEKDGDKIFHEHGINREFAASVYKDKILGWLNKEPKLSYLRIWEKLKEEENYKYGYDSVRYYLNNLRLSKEIYPVFEQLAPGLEAQVDFGYVGLIYNPEKKKRTKAYVFCMRLIYSRYDYYEVVFDQKVKTFIKCHENAFKYYNGVPKNVKIDNLKAGVLESNFYTPVYQQEYLNFSKHYKFNPITCRPYKPKDKAHVENGIKYVKGNFFAGRSFRDDKDCNERLLRWMEEKSLRRHGTTRKKPKEEFLNIEQKVLTKLPVEPYIIYEYSKHKLHPDCYLRAHNNLYSAPHEYVGKELIVRTSDFVVEVYTEDFNLICCHKKVKGTGIREKNPAHFPEWIELISTGHYNYYMKQLDKFGEEVKDYCKKVFRDHKTSGYRMVQGIIALANKHGKEKLSKAIKRGSCYQNYSYMCLKNILDKNLINSNQLEDIEDFSEKQDSNKYKVNLKEYDLFYH